MRIIKAILLITFLMSMTTSYAQGSIKKKRFNIIKEEEEKLERFKFVALKLNLPSVLVDAPAIRSVRMSLSLPLSNSEDLEFTFGLSLPQLAPQLYDNVRDMSGQIYRFEYHKFIDNSTYIGFDYLHRRQEYNNLLNVRKINEAKTSFVPHAQWLHIRRITSSFNVLIGHNISKNNWLIDAYCGIGAREKNVTNELSDAEFLSGQSLHQNLARAENGTISINFILGVKLGFGLVNLK